MILRLAPWLRVPTVGPQQTGNVVRSTKMLPSLQRIGDRPFLWELCRNKGQQLRQLVREVLVRTKGSPETKGSELSGIYQRDGEAETKNPPTPPNGQGLHPSRAGARLQRKPG